MQMVCTENSNPLSSRQPRFDINCSTTDPINEQTNFTRAYHCIAIELCLYTEGKSLSLSLWLTIPRFGDKATWPFKVIQGHQLLYQVKAHVLFRLVINCDRIFLTIHRWHMMTIDNAFILLWRSYNSTHTQKKRKKRLIRTQKLDKTI